MSVFSPLPLPHTLRRNYPLAERVEGGWDPGTLWARKEWRMDLDWQSVVLLLKAVRESGSLSEEVLTGEMLKGAPIEQLVRKIRAELYEGSGVVWMRGLQGLSEEVLRRAYALISLKVGGPIDTYGRLYNVQDTGRSSQNVPDAFSTTRYETTFHTDSSNVLVEPAAVGLLCVQPARSGGSIIAASGISAYQALSLEHRRLLSRDFVRNIVTPGLSASDIFRNRFPVFQWSEAEGLYMRYMRYWIEKGHERIGWPLTSAEVEAFEALDAAFSENAVRFDMAAGDMVWFNNRTIAHNRTSFEEDPARPRKMVRMWLSRQPE